jgi:tetratricopeptide (TPR) repeat protein
MRAHFHTKRGTELLALLADTDAHFHKDNRWSEDTIAVLSSACLDCELFEQAVKYCGELITLCKRTHANRGIGHGPLSGYCGQLARAYAGLGKTAEAVDAACEAVVSWGTRQHERQVALKALSQVLREAKDLQQYVQSLDRDSEETGSDKPIVRKALGIVFAEKQQWAQATAQLQIAFQLQPNDPETSAKLVECYDAQQNKQAAISQLLASLDSNPRDIQLCRELGKRYRELGRTADVERAHTSIVELLPNEAESNAMLAEIREQPDRWPDAAAHWQQVARIRRLEPTGLLRLAAAQIHMQQWEQAKETISRLRSQTWPERFRDLPAKVDELETRIRNETKVRHPGKT